MTSSESSSLQESLCRVTQENHVMQERLVNVHVEMFENLSVLDRVMRQNYKLYHDLRKAESSLLADREVLSKIEEAMIKAGVHKAPIMEMVRNVLEHFQHQSGVPRPRPPLSRNMAKRQRLASFPEQLGKPTKLHHQWEKLVHATARDPHSSVST